MFLLFVILSTSAHALKIPLLDGTTNKVYSNRITINTYDKTYFKDVKFTYVLNRQRRFNSTNLRFQLLRAITDDFWVSLNFYQWINNQYLHFAPLTFGQSLAEILKQDLFGIGTGMKEAFRNELPFPPNNYNLTLETSAEKTISMPFKGRVKVLGKLLDKKREVFSLSWYGEINNDISKCKRC